jgi:hypothetical protein
MHRSYEQSVVVCVPTAGASEQQVRAAAELWAPGSGGELGDLRHAMVVAGDLMT